MPHQIITNHGVEESQEFSHAGDDRDFIGFSGTKTRRNAKTETADCADKRNRVCISNLRNLRNLRLLFFVPSWLSILKS
jgi:hypothetical protein